jgi:hypothetical protein
VPSLRSLKAVDALGDRPKMLREAVDLLLAQEVQAIVWLLFENEPGLSARLVGVFSSPALVMEAPRVQQMNGLGTWQERTPGLWVCQLVGGEDFYFSVEGWRVKRLSSEPNAK